jgi:hypothetical protein
VGLCVAELFQAYSSIFSSFDLIGADGRIAVSAA